MNLTYSQSGGCGTTSSGPPFNYDQLMQQKHTLQQKQNGLQNSDIICIDISFHILENSTGDVATESEMDAILNIINDQYNQYGIFFYEESTNFIVDNEYYDIDDFDEFYDLIEIQNDPNTLDFYIVNSFADYAGAADNIPGTSIVLESSAIHSNSDIHEVGHCFGLYHTHETDRFGTENIQRSEKYKNCKTNGDLLCSTPADPKLLDDESDPSVYKVDASCNYTGSETRLGLPYDPDTHNYMSYSRQSCRNGFTQEQVDVMRAMLQTSSILQPIRSTTCTAPSISGPSTICSGSSDTYTLQNVPFGATVNWSVSSDNLSIVFSTSSSVVVKALNNMVNGEGTITATVNGFEVNKTVHVGRPTVVYGILGNSGDKPVNSTSSFHVTSVNNNSYHWSISTMNSDCSLNSGNPPYTTTPKFVVNGGYFSSTATGSSVTLVWGSCPGRYKISCRAVNTCSYTGVGDKTVDVFDGSSGGGGDGCPEDELNTYPNPVTQGGDVTVNIIDPEPCIGSHGGGQNPANASNNVNTGTIQSWVKIYDLNGIEKYNGTFTGNNFNITGLNLPHGLYVIHVNTSAGFSKQEMLAVD